MPSLASLKKEIYQLIDKVKDPYTSMYQDLVSVRKAEIDFLNGFVINLEKKGIQTPYNQPGYLKVIKQQGKAQEKYLRKVFKIAEDNNIPTLEASK